MDKTTPQISYKNTEIGTKTKEDQIEAFEPAIEITERDIRARLGKVKNKKASGLGNHL